MKTQPFEKHVWAEIDLDALRHNFRAVKARAGDLPLCAVVKADSYGHGAVQCARVFAQEGAAWLAVSCLTEAVQLRQDGQTLPILILGHVQPEYAQTLIHEDITVACYSTEQEVISAVHAEGLPIVKSVCPADGVTVREQTKEFVKERCRTDHAFRQKTLHALQESGIDGWRPVHTGRGSFAITNEEE